MAAPDHESGNENIPLHDLAVRSEAVVEAKDGVIGYLENFTVNPNDKHVTGIVIRTGRRLAQSRLAIPVSAIDHFDEEAIYLSLSKQETKALTTWQELDKEYGVSGEAPAQLQDV